MMTGGRGAGERGVAVDEVVGKVFVLGGAVGGRPVGGTVENEVERGHC